MRNVAINGFGRIGRCFFRAAIERKAKCSFVAVNDLTSTENLAYLLKYDSVYGPWKGHTVRSTKSALIVDGKKIPVYSEKDPAALPWNDLKVDVVIESTGFFTEYEGAKAHLKAGAKRVIITAPTKSSEIGTFVCGVNDKKYKKQRIVSNASCTTNCVAPVIAVLEKAFGVKKAVLNTAHAYTATQKLVDAPDAKDFRRGRAAAENMSPSSTGAAIATTLAIPVLKNKFDGIAVRVPVIDGSLVDITAVLKRKVTVDQVNAAFLKAEKLPQFKGILRVSKDPLVSSDIIGDSYSAIIDMDMTMVVDGDLVKVLAWYDNEWGYSNRLVDMVLK